MHSNVRFTTSSCSLSALTRRLFMHICLALKCLVFPHYVEQYFLTLSSFKGIYFCIFYFQPDSFASYYLAGFHSFIAVIQICFFLL